MASSREVLERWSKESPKQFIERLRRVKFRIGAGAPSLLAPDLHMTIKQLSVELNESDFHFMKEIVQNAEDNNYSEAVIPSLEFQLIEEDLAEVGASTTLVILNNELGLLSDDVVALCSVGKSTKMGRRNEGYIGCKGVGFKSVFMICETPLIISNGYRIRFQAKPTEEAGVGYIVLEWMESPSNEKILSAIGRHEMPTTVIILPILDAKVELVRKHLKELSPEIILFLTRIRELKVVDKTKRAVGSGSIDLLRIKRSKPISGIRSNVCKFFEVTLTVEKSEGTISGTFAYFIFQQGYPVTHPVQERKEIHEWTVTLAFPREWRPTSGQVGDVFSFLPTELRTGFPFLVNADFLLTTSRETIRFDSPWNVGILDRIPVAFELSFKIMLNRKLLLPPQVTLTLEALSHWYWRDAYKFLPHNTVWDAYRHNSVGAKESSQKRQKLCVERGLASKLEQLDKVRANIFERLENKPLVGVWTMTVGRQSMYYESAEFCVQIKLSFRNILKKLAVLSHHASPSVVFTRPNGSRNPNGFAIVDEYIQRDYACSLAALGVPEITSSQYLSFLRDSDWLLSLPEILYFQVLTFFAFELKIPQGIEAFGELRRIKNLKVRDKRGKVELTSFSDLSGYALLYTSSVGDAEWISAWVDEFMPWYNVWVLPTETAQAFKEASNGEELISWINKYGPLPN